MAKEIPVYTFEIGDNEEFAYDKISLVDKPAIQADWVAFAEQSKPYLFVADADKQILAGAFMIPNLPIYRFDEQTKEEYYVMFTKEIIEKLHHNFNKNNRNTEINIMHSEKMAEAYVTESWLIEDKEHDKSKIYGFDLPIGTSFGLVKIENKEFWDTEIKTGNLRGFSIEAFLQRKEKPINTIKMSNQKFIETTLKDGTKIKVSENGVVVDSAVMVIDAEGNETPAPDGEHTLEDGTIIITSGGKITEVKEAMANEPAPATEPAPAVDVEAMVNEKIDALKVEMQNALAEIVAKLTEMEAGKAKAETEVEEMKAQFAQFSEIPAVKSMFTKTDKQINKKPDQYDTLKKLKSILNK